MDTGGPKVTLRVGDTDRHGGGGRLRAVCGVSVLLFLASLSPASVLTLICSAAQETAGSSSGFEGEQKPPGGAPGAQGLRLAAPGFPKLCTWCGHGDLGTGSGPVGSATAELSRTPGRATWPDPGAQRGEPQALPSECDRTPGTLRQVRRPGSLCRGQTHGHAAMVELCLSPTPGVGPYLETQSSEMRSG